MYELSQRDVSNQFVSPETEEEGELPLPLYSSGLSSLMLLPLEWQMALLGLHQKHQSFDSSMHQIRVSQIKVDFRPPFSLSL